jgi:hypothetical protein
MSRGARGHPLLRRVRVIARLLRRRRWRARQLSAEELEELKRQLFSLLS